MIEIGRKLKQYRLQLGLTQEELASRTELTKGYISQLENDLCSPSITTLQDILQVLGVTLEQFFATPKVEKVVYHQNDYFVSQNEGGTNTWLIPNSQVKDIEPIILTLPPKTQCAERLPFEGEEFGYVLEGKVSIVLGNKHYTAKKGEAFYYSASQPHYIENKTANTAKFLWISTPPNF
jgi:transcriptional regulator with XRE-family HTH domain